MLYPAKQPEPFPDNDDDKLEKIFKFLYDLDSKHYQNISNLYNSWGWTPDNKEHDRIENLLIRSELVDYNQQRLLRMIKLSLKGREILEKCNLSYKEYKGLKAKEIIKKEEFDNLTFQKLRGDVEKLTNELGDYLIIKRRANYAFVFSILMLIIAAITLILKLIGKN